MDIGVLLCTLSNHMPVSLTILFIDLECYMLLVCEYFTTLYSVQLFY